jgi:DNA-binding transcriptional LysR family regulator
MQTYNAELRMQAALAGLGIARVPMTAAETEIAQGRLVRVMPDYPLPPLRVFALLPDRRLQPRKVRAFMEAIESMMGADLGDLAEPAARMAPAGRVEAFERMEQGEV